jgi:hypothetical protein
MSPGEAALVSPLLTVIRVALGVSVFAVGTGARDLAAGSAVAVAAGVVESGFAAAGCDVGAAVSAAGGGVSGAANAIPPDPAISMAVQTLHRRWLRKVEMPFGRADTAAAVA